MTLNLGIDCCTKWTSIGVSENGCILTEIHLNIGRKQSAELAKAVNEALRFSGRSLTQVNLIVLTTGPGSFTGVRVGLSYGLALATALKCPVVPVNTLEFIAHQALPFFRNKTLVPVLSAKRGFVYAAAYDYPANSNLLFPLISPGFFSDEDLHEILIRLKNGLVLIQEKNRCLDLPSSLMVINGTDIPSGGLLSTLGDLYFKRACSSREVKGLYLRPPDIG